MSSGCDGGFSYPCKRNSDGLPVNNNGICDKQVQTDDDSLENSWEKLKEDYLDESACSICLESFVTSGDHQVAALKCGHIFGEICIRRWLSEAKGDGGPKCPTCKSKVKATDIKIIVPKSIKKLDSAVVVQFKELAATTRNERTKVQAEVVNINQKIQEMRETFMNEQKLFDAASEEVKRLEAIEMELQLAAANARFSANTKAYHQKASFQPLVVNKRLDLEVGSESRLCAVSDMYGIIMIAQKKGSGHCQSFGLTNIGTSTFRTTEYIGLHEKQIKDIAFHPFDAVVLSASLDKTVKITDIFSSTAVATFTCASPVWSCCWNEVDTRTFYAGLSNGTVHEFDTRNNTEPKSIISAPPGTTGTPCVSVNFVRSEQYTGIITTRLQNTSFSYRGSHGFVTQPLPVSGSFMSSHFERKTAKLLYSARPSKHNSRVTHSLWSLSLNSNGEEPLIKCAPDRCFYGGIHADQVVKGRLFPHPNREDSCLVFAGDQDIGGLIVWDTLNTEPVQKLGGIGPTFDIAQVDQCNSTNSSFVALTDKSLYYYNWTLN
ncbi:E3 ubiquitin-protein ligase RFWD3-like [Panonychus citri]|uniref:E3 ubiquitin-protein ligase RFWD3-like n=1 Tax=Panonychus citri TaxID=50023 RepID=UPI0023077A71|nr:E3 ubiquitin-protein ligase RFWD3-like [Panonychus citri]